MSCMTTIEGKGQLSAHIKSDIYLVPRNLSKVTLHPGQFLMEAKLFIKAP